MQIIYGISTFIDNIVKESNGYAYSYAITLRLLGAWFDNWLERLNKPRSQTASEIVNVHIQD